MAPAKNAVPTKNNPRAVRTMYSPDNRKPLIASREDPARKKAAKEKAAPKRATVLIIRWSGCDCAHTLHDKAQDSNKKVQPPHSSPEFPRPPQSHVRDRPRHDAPASLAHAAEKQAPPRRGHGKAPQPKGVSTAKRGQGKNLNGEVSQPRRLPHGESRN